MSWDIFVQQLPHGIRHVDDIPDDFIPRPLGSRMDIVAGIRDVFPSADFSDPQWVRIEEDEFSIEINIGSDGSVRSFALHVRGDRAAAGAVAALLDRLEVQALDPQSPTGLFDAAAAAHSLDSWRSYRDRVVED